MPIPPVASHSCGDGLVWMCFGNRPLLWTVYIYHRCELSDLLLMLGLGPACLPSEHDLTALAIASVGYVSLEEAPTRRFFVSAVLSCSSSVMERFWVKTMNMAQSPTSILRQLASPPNNFLIKV